MLVLAQLETLRQHMAPLSPGIRYRSSLDLPVVPRAQLPQEGWGESEVEEVCWQAGLRMLAVCTLERGGGGGTV